jgi:hypothetical protein
VTRSEATPQADIPFVRGLARRVARSNWPTVGGDVLKVLYESVITQDTRKELGEYYTPDWLAAKLAAVGPIRERRSETLGEFLNGYLDRRRMGGKPNTVSIIERVRS